MAKAARTNKQSRNQPVEEAPGVAIPEDATPIYDGDTIVGYTNGPEWVEPLPDPSLPPFPDAERDWPSAQPVVGEWTEPEMIGHYDSLDPIGTTGAPVIGLAMVMALSGALVGFVVGLLVGLAL